VGGNVSRRHSMWKRVGILSTNTTSPPHHHLQLGGINSHKTLPCSSESCFNRMAEAKPAGPAPTMTTSYSMASLGALRGSSSSADEHRARVASAERGVV